MIEELEKELGRLREFFEGYMMRIKLLKGSGKSFQSIIPQLDANALKIDEIEETIYEQKIEPLTTPKQTFQDEIERLNDLIDLIEERKNQRLDLVREYEDSTNQVLLGLFDIVEMKSLNVHKKRLNSISTYLKNMKAIDDVTEQINEKNLRLKKGKEEQRKYEESNVAFENELFNHFITNFLPSGLDSDQKSDLELKNKEDEELLKLEINNYEILQTSREKGIKSGLTDEEINEYLREYPSKIKFATNEYYNSYEQLVLLRIYDKLKGKKYDYKSMIAKRKEIINLRRERERKRLTCKIEEEDILIKFFELILKQMREIETQSENYSAIETLEKEIENRISRLTELERQVNTDEMKKLTSTLTNKEENQIEDKKEDKPIIKATLEDQVEDKKQESIIKDVYENKEEETEIVDLGTTEIIPIPEQEEIKEPKITIEEQSSKIDKEPVQEEIKYVKIKLPDEENKQEERLFDFDNPFKENENIQTVTAIPEDKEEVFKTVEENSNPLVDLANDDDLTSLISGDLFTEEENYNTKTRVK